MAVTARTYNLSAFWNSTDLMNTLQTALADVGYHSATQTGTILTFTNTAGTTLAAKKGQRYLVKQSATSGSGLYSTWDIVRNAATGAVATVTLVSGGENYAINNTITIAGADIGGTTPTDNITITVSTVSDGQGSTTTWYDADTADPYTWGVCCVTHDKTKKLGQTFYSFYTPANPTSYPILYMRAGPGFQSTTNVFNGVNGIDWVNSSAVFNTTYQHFSQAIASTNAVPLTLTTYQSGIDTKFVVFQFSENAKYGKLYRWPFFLSNYNTATQAWNLDDNFTGSVYEIGKAQVQNTTEASIYTTTPCGVLGRRQGEWGHNGTLANTFASGGRITAYYESLYGRRYTAHITTGQPSIYQSTENDLVQTGLEYNPVITGIPIAHTMIPCPYFIPADFGITEIIGTNSIEYGEIISVGATTKWKVLQYGNNQALSTYNSAIAFVAKTVN